MQGEQVGKCFGGSFGLSNPMGAYGQVDLTVGRNECKKKGGFSQGETVTCVNCVSIQGLHPSEVRMDCKG